MFAGICRCTVPGCKSTTFISIPLLEFDAADMFDATVAVVEGIDADGLLRFLLFDEWPFDVLAMISGSLQFEQLKGWKGEKNTEHPKLRTRLHLA